jgi:predicted RNase H-like nuclease (RuvC/YqgF family)
MNPTLISGFEDVITHINQQDQRVMSLEEENKKLKEQLKAAREGSLLAFQEVEIEDLEEERDRFKKLNEGLLKKLRAEIKKFQEENEKLEAKVLRLQSSEQDLEKKLDTGGWSPTSSPEPKQ